MSVLALRPTALVALAISVSGCVMEAYGSRACSGAQPWVGLPTQDVIKRFGEPERVTGDTARQKYVWKEYENYSHDYDYTYYEQGYGNTPSGSVLNQKTGTANQSDYCTYIYEFFADASDGVVDMTVRGECRQFQAPFTPQGTIGSASRRLVSDVAETPESNAEASPPLALP